MNYDVYHIPTNFTDAGRVMGLFELRNLIEALLLTLPTLYLCIAFLPFRFTTKLIITSISSSRWTGGVALAGWRATATTSSARGSCTKPLSFWATSRCLRKSNL